MKTIPVFLFLLFSVCVIGQDDDFCICMLDQPAYEASLDDSNVNTENEFSKLFSPQVNMPSKDSSPLIFLQEEDGNDKDDFLEEEKESETVKAKRFSSKKRIKSKNKARIPKWNAHKKPKKYKGKCPFF